MRASTTSGGLRFLHYCLGSLPPIPITAFSSSPSSSLLSSFGAFAIMDNTSNKSSPFSAFSHSGRSGGRGKGLEMKDNHERSRGRGGGGNGSGSGKDKIDALGRLFVMASSPAIWPLDMLPITAFRLNGKNYAIWARTVEVYYVGKTESAYLTDDPPDDKATNFAEWKAINARIRLQLWNSMEPQISSTLVFLPTAKLVWARAQELYSGVNNLRRTCDLHQTYFSLTLGDSSLEDYYAKFRGICEELNNCQPISIDIQVMRRQRESMHVACFLSGLLSSYDPVRSLLLEARDLPSLSKVFSRLRQASLPGTSVVAPSLSDRSALATSIFNGSGRGFGRSSRDSRGRGRGIYGLDSGCGGRGFGRNFDRGGRQSGGDRDRGRGWRYCTYCHQENHTVDFCWDLHGHPVPHQVTVSEDDGHLATFGSVPRVGLNFMC